MERIQEMGRSGGPASGADRADRADRIAFVVDSCCDVPQSYLERYPFYLVPMMINYSDGSYLDRVEIQPSEVYARFAAEIPRTSTPSAASAHEAFSRVVADGFEKALCVTISSGLSSTASMMRSVAAEFGQLDVRFVDTKSIGIGAGAAAMYAAELAEAGMGFEALARRVADVAAHSRVFFVVDGLEYLYKGGRIGRAAYALGSVMNVRPVITCEPEHGRYVVCGKAKGRKQSIAKLIRIAQKHIASERHRIVVAEGMAHEEAARIIAEGATHFPHATSVFDGGQVSPALVVHTGPGLVGIAVQNLP